MTREGRCHVRRQDSSDTGTVTTPTTTDTNTNKINPSSATDLTSPGPVVGVRNDGQQLVRRPSRPLRVRGVDGQLVGRSGAGHVPLPGQQVPENVRRPSRPEGVRGVDGQLVGR